MTTYQLFYSLCGVIVAANGILATLFKLYLDAKIDPIKEQVAYLTARLDKMSDGLTTRLDNINKTITEFLANHEGRISALEERTKPK